MRPRGLFRGAIAGVLLGIGIAAAFGWTGVSSVMAEAATPANTILVIDGHVPGGQPAAFDLEALKKLPITRVTTMTPWTDGENLYEGVRIRDLLVKLGAEGTVILADAIDDYQVKI